MNLESIKIYHDSVRNNFRFMKSAKNVQEAYLRAIPVEGYGYLLPVCDAHKMDEELIRKLTKWRNKNVTVYPTQFEATDESTLRWLSERLLSSDERILFLVVSNVGKVIGHLGFNGCLNEEGLFEVDNVVRGEQSIERGIFSKAMHALMEWARTVIGTQGFFLRVMDDNENAIAFYKNNGFKEINRIPLIKESKETMVVFKEAESFQKPDKYFVKMEWKPEPDLTIGKTMILTAGPSISAKEAAYSFDAALNGWNKNWSKYLTAFEKQFAEYVGAKYAMATSSCTGALQIALLALDIGPGDEVIVPDQTWVATANAVRYVGATPVFADVELDTWNLDARSVEKLITNKTKAIMPVHMYGHPARMSEILNVAKRHNLKVVEDAAPAIGAQWQGKSCGSFGDFGAFSFQGAKLMVTGEGGMLVTNDDRLYEKAHKIWDQGRNPSKTFWIDQQGVKFKMSNVQAAVGLAQLERVNELIEMKRRIFSWYEEDLADLNNISLNKEVADAKSIYWMTSILLKNNCTVFRDDLIKLLKERNVDSRPVFPAISQYPIWGYETEPMPTANYIGNNALNLPSGVCLKREHVAYITAQIRDLLMVKNDRYKTAS